MQRKVLADRVDVVEVEPALELMRPGEIADGVEHLVAHVLARLRRKSLAPHARDAEHFQGRPTLILERADGVRALRIERVYRLIAVGDLETGFVDHFRRADPQMRQREHQVVALEHGSAAARHVAAERLDVLVQIARPVDARRQRLIRTQLVIDFAENLVRADVVRHVARLDREAGPLAESAPACRSSARGRSRCSCRQW